MTQYTQPADPNAKTNTAAVTARDSDKDHQRLRELVDRQGRDIEELSRTVRRLQNELRVAINSFNLKNHG